MGDTLVVNVRALEPGEGVIAAWVRFQDGKITAVGPADRVPGDVPQTIDGGDRLLTPGLIDIHTHGIEHFAYEAGPEQLIAASRRLGRYGVTSVLPTFYRTMSRPRLKELEQLAAAMSSAEDVCMPGLHLEGPFLGLPGAGAQTIPGDVGLLDDLVAAAGGRVAAMSVSPEVPNVLPVIERLCERGIVPFITHTQATVEQTEAAIDAGARHATHFYDVFPSPKETDPGVRPASAVEAILADRRCTADFIAAGVHVHRTAIRAIEAAKGWQRALLATDSNVGAGLPPGVYTSPLDGTLAGSALTMDRGIANLLAWLDLPAEQVWAMGTRNPAKLLRLAAKGTLHVGADADLVLWDQTGGGLRAWRTWVQGRSVYEATD